MIYIYMLLLLVLFRVWKRKNILVKGLIVTYIISAVSAIALMYLDPNCIFLYQTKYEPLFYLLIILIIVFDGFSNFEFNVIKINNNKNKILKFADFIGWLYVPVVLLLLFNDVNVLTNVNLSTYRVEGDYYATGLFKGGLFLSLCIYISELSFVPQFLFFYLIQFQDVSSNLKIRLFLASFSFAMMTLMFAGRDGIVFWIMNAVIFYFLFNNWYTPRIIKSIKIWGIFLVAMIAIPFLVITAARFVMVGNDSILSIITPLVDYIGQGPHVFCQAFYVDRADIKGYDVNALTTRDIQSFQLYLGWTFGTFAKSIVWRYGYLGAIIVSLGFNIIVRMVIRMFKRKNDIWSIFILIMLFQIPFWGVFYYRYAINNMEIVYLFFTVICIYISFNYKSKGIQRLYKI